MILASVMYMKMWLLRISILLVRPNLKESDIYCNSSMEHSLIMFINLLFILFINTVHIFSYLSGRTNKKYLRDHSIYCKIPIQFDRTSEFITIN